MLIPILLAVGLAAEGPVQFHATKDAPGVKVIATPPGQHLPQLPAGTVTQEQGERWLRFCLVDLDNGDEGPPILGTYRREGVTLTFVPRHPLTPSQLYRATLILGRARITAEHRTPPAAASLAPVVEKVYPSGDVLPANHLRFYLHFSKSMRGGRAIFDQIRLLDDQGKPVVDPWRRTELWSADGKRLTLWVHPGRIKRGIGPREDEGPVMEPNRQYTLEVGREMADSAGKPLAQVFTKKFRTTAEKRTRPLPEKWTLHAPPRGTLQPLRVEFPDPIDRALLDRFLVVKDERGRPIAGRIEVGKEERSWLFHPEQPWADGEFSLTVDGELEDVAGNTPVRLFDVDLKDAPPTPPKLTLRFHPKP